MSSIRTVAVIGAGPAGRSFAFLCAQVGFAVTLEDVMPSKLRRAQDDWAKWSAAQREFSGSLRYAATVEEAVREADLAIDFVPDELESKLEIFSMLDRMAPPRTLLCTPTRVLSLTDLASCTYRPAQCVALRGAGEDALREPVELVRSRFNESTVLEATVQFLTGLGLNPKLVDDTEEPMLMR